MENRTCPKLRGCLVISLWSEVVQESEGEKMSQFNKEKLDTLWLLQVSLKPKQKTDLKGIIYSSQPTSVEVPIFVSWRMYSYHNTNPWMEISVNFLESWPHPLLRSKTCIVRKYAFLIQRVKGLQVGWWRLKTRRLWWNTFKETQVNEKILCVHGSEEVRLLKYPFYPKTSTYSVQSLLKLQGYFSSGYKKKS